MAKPQSERFRRRPNGDDRGPPPHRRSRSHSRSRDLRGAPPPRGVTRDDGSGGGVVGGGGGGGYARDGPPARPGPPHDRDFPPPGIGGRPAARSRSRSRGGGGGGGPDRPIVAHERSRERYSGPVDGPRPGGGGGGGGGRADSFPRNREVRGPGPDDRRQHPARADSYRDEYYGSGGGGAPPPRDLDRLPHQGYGGGEGGGGGRGGDSGYGPKGGDAGTRFDPPVSSSARLVC